MSEDLDARLNRFMDATEAFQESMLKKVEKMERGMYGEADNLTPGFGSRIFTLEQKVKKLFADRKKVIWVGSTAVVIIGGLIEVIKLLL